MRGKRCLSNVRNPFGYIYIGTCRCALRTKYTDTTDEVFVVSFSSF